MSGLSDALRLLYPPHCLVCANHYATDFPAPGVCPQCLGAVVFNRPPFCVRCSRPLGTDIRHMRCRHCRRQNPSFDFAWSACLYEDPLKDLIHRFKYHQKTGLRRILADLMASFIREYNLDMEQFDVIIPVPLSSTRLRERGYNQTQLLAEELVRTFSIPCTGNHLVRARHTQPQTLLDEKQRWTNIKGAFTIRQPNVLKRKNILLIDDLLTTGATACEAARALKAAGAGTVGVLTLAITGERQ